MPSALQAERKRGWTDEMEAELEHLIIQQTKGDAGVTEDRIAWQVIRALSTTMGHLSKDAIRKKGKRMLQEKAEDAKALADGKEVGDRANVCMRGQQLAAPIRCDTPSLTCSGPPAACP